MGNNCDNYLALKNKNHFSAFNSFLVISHYNAIPARGECPKTAQWQNGPQIGADFNSLTGTVGQSHLLYPLNIAPIWGPFCHCVVFRSSPRMGFDSQMDEKSANCDWFGV
jgi:hypothetical protein